MPAKREIVCFRGICLLCVVLGLFVSPAAAKIDPETMVGAWLCDDDKGDILKDVSGRGHDGIINGAPAWTAGKVGKSVDIAASTYARVKATPALSLKSFTLTCWMLTKSGGNWIGVISKSNDNPTRNYTLYIHMNSNTASISIGDQAAGAWKDATGKTSVNDGKWHHAVISFDDKSRVGRVYTDGMLEAEYTVATPVPQNDADLVFAAWHHAGGNGGYVGQLDEIGLFNVSLSPEDVKSITQDGLQAVNLAINAQGKLAATWAALRGRDRGN